MAEVICLVFIAANPSTPALKAEVQRLEGTWTVVAMHAKGKPLPAKGIPFRKIVFAENKKVAEKEGKGCAVFSYRLDLEKSPKTIDAAEQGDRPRKITLYGVYQLKGETMRLCLSDSMKDRPTDFRTAPESNAILLELKRAKR
jgi:uncharacterized protein (TIGR03067 family)